MISDTASTIEFNPEALERVLQKQGITQAELARMSGFKHRNTIHKILRGERHATATELLRFAALLNVPAEAFMKNPEIS